MASFFVSRVDTKIDAQLPPDSPLRGKAAIANAKLAYDAFRSVFGGARFGKLQLAKANLQRPLWASTSTKNPAYPDTIYVDNLIGPATVNTVPPPNAACLQRTRHGCRNHHAGPWKKPASTLRNSKHGGFRWMSSPANWRKKA